MATATGLDPHTTISGRGSIGSTKMSIVPWLGQVFLREADAFLLLPGLDAVGVEQVLRLHRDQPRLAVKERVPRRLEHGAAGAAAADPALGDRAVGQDHRLGAGLGGGRGDGADHGRKREGLALLLERGDEVEDVAGAVHRFRSS